MTEPRLPWQRRPLTPTERRNYTANLAADTTALLDDINSHLTAIGLLAGIPALTTKLIEDAAGHPLREADTATLAGIHATLCATLTALDRKVGTFHSCTATPPEQE